MTFDVEQADRLLTTTRTVRHRLDLETPVPDEVLHRLIDVAEQAPSGSNETSRRWVVVRDPAQKARLAQLYRDASLPLLQYRAAIAADATLADGLDPRGRRVFDSAVYLAENLERVPVLVLVTIHGVHDGSGRPGLFDSVLQAAWSFCLAARARGLGTAWTTLHLLRAEEAAEVLGIPDGVTQAVLIPVAYTSGEFHPVPRRPAAEITYVDHWGLTDAGIPPAERTHAAQGRGVRVEVDIPAPASVIWPVVTDVDVPGAFSSEAAGATWDDPDETTRGVGSTFRGRNAPADMGHPAIDELLESRLGGKLEWEMPCQVSRWVPGSAFAYVVGEPANPTTEWGFELTPLVGGGTRVAAFVTMLAQPSGTSRAAAANPASAEEIVLARLLRIRANLRATLTGVASLVTSTVTSTTGKN